MSYTYNLRRRFTPPIGSLRALNYILFPSQFLEGFNCFIHYIYKYEICQGFMKIIFYKKLNFSLDFTNFRGIINLARVKCREFFNALFTAQNLEN